MATSRQSMRDRLHVCMAMSALVTALATWGVGPADADQVLGRHGSCAAIWDTDSAAVAASRKGALLTCFDGDPTCDRDGVANGSCTVELAACVGTSVPGCTPGSLQSLHFSRSVSRSLQGFAPPSAGVVGCGAPGEVTLPLHPKTGKPVGEWDRSSPVRFVMHGKKRFSAPVTVQCIPCLDCGQPTASCKRSAPGLPAELVLTVPPATGSKGNGSDLDVGWADTFQNFPVPGGSSLKYCLTGCDGKTTFDCLARGTTARVAIPSR